MGRPFKLGRPFTRAERTLRQKAWRTRNKERLNAERRQRYASDHEWRKYKADEAKKRDTDTVRGWHLKNKYGIAVADYQRMLSEQGGGCAICRSTVADKLGRWLAVDHCHKTGRIRGLLCFACNLAIAKLKDDWTIAKRASEYLRANSDLV